MNKEKKQSAADLMAEYIVSCTGCPDMLKNHDFSFEPLTPYQEKAKVVKNYFQEKADIPDGWEVIQEAYKVLCNCINLCREEGEDDQYFEPVWRFIYEQLEEAGVEVKDN